MPPQLLERCLEDGLTPQDWYDRLNGFVFLWANDRNVRDLAKTYRGDASVLITLDGDALLAAHGGQAFMTRFNTGYAMRRPKPRGLGAFTPYADWVRQGWRPKEVVVEKGVPDLAALVLSAEPVGG